MEIILSDLNLGSSFTLANLIEAILIGVLAVALITLLVLYFTRKNIQNKRKDVIALNCTNVRVYTINFKNKTLRFFDRSNMSNQRLNGIEYLFNQCEEKHRDSFINWIYSFEQGKENVSNFFTVSVKVKKSTCLSIYRVTSYNAKEKILHLENTLLPGIDAKLNNRKSINYIVSKDHLTTLFKTKKRYQKDCTVIYMKLSNLIDKDGTKDLSRFDSSTMSMTSIYEPLDSIYKYLSKDRLMCFINDDEVALFDFTNLTQNELQSFCKDIHSEVDRYIDLKALGKMYYLSIGCSFKNFREKDIKKVYTQAKNMCSIAEKLKNEKTAIYGVHSMSMGENDNSIDQNDIDILIKNKTFRIYYTPVLSYDGTCDDIDFVEFVPFGTSFKVIQDAIVEAKNRHKLDDLLEVLIGTLDDHLAHYPKFKCVMSTSLRFVVEINEALNRHKRLKDKIYLSFKQTEIEDLYEADYVVEDVLKSLVKDNIKTILEVVDSSINVPSELLKLFSFFTVSLNDEEEENRRKLSSFISARSILLPYEKNIFAINLKNESEIEMTFNLGYRQYTCKEIANVSSSPYIPDKGWVEDLKEANENQID